MRRRREEKRACQNIENNRKQWIIERAVQAEDGWHQGEGEEEGEDCQKENGIEA